jgi:hypothetical protein
MDQGNQIGRKCAHGAMVYFGQLSENFRSSPNFGLLLPIEKNMHKFIQKIGWDILRRFFHKLICHPALDQKRPQTFFSDGFTFLAH